MAISERLATSIFLMDKAPASSGYDVKTEHAMNRQSGAKRGQQATGKGLIPPEIAAGR